MDGDPIGVIGRQSFMKMHINVQDQKIYTCGANSVLRVWDLNTLKLVREMNNASYIYCLSSFEDFVFGCGLDAIG